MPSAIRSRISSRKARGFGAAGRASGMSTAGAAARDRGGRHVPRLARAQACRIPGGSRPGGPAPPRRLSGRGTDRFENARIPLLVTGRPPIEGGHGRLLVQPSAVSAGAISSTAGSAPATSFTNRPERAASSVTGTSPPPMTGSVVPAPRVRVTARSPSIPPGRAGPGEKGTRNSCRAAGPDRPPAPRPDAAEPPRSPGQRGPQEAHLHLLETDLLGGNGEVGIAAGDRLHRSDGNERYDFRSLGRAFRRGGHVRGLHRRQRLRPRGTDGEPGARSDSAPHPPDARREGFRSRRAISETAGSSVVGIISARRPSPTIGRGGAVSFAGLAARHEPPPRESCPNARTRARPSGPSCRSLWWAPPDSPSGPPSRKSAPPESHSSSRAICRRWDRCRPAESPPVSRDRPSNPHQERTASCRSPVHRRSRSGLAGSGVACPASITGAAESAATAAGPFRDRNRGDDRSLS